MPPLLFWRQWGGAGGGAGPGRGAHGCHQGGDVIHQPPARAPASSSVARLPKPLAARGGEKKNKKTLKKKNPQCFPSLCAVGL